MYGFYFNLQEFGRKILIFLLKGGEIELLNSPAMRRFLGATFSLLRIAICVDLTSSSSFSLAERIQASLILARSCVSCTNFSLLRSLKIGCVSEKSKYLPR